MEEVGRGGEGHGGKTGEDKGRREKIYRVGSSRNKNQRGSFLFWNKDHRTYSGITGKW